ncbi:MAG: hypothetical protein K8L91_19750 [Anaerolineae bacterium]|nr:hypothetical protein [Anaerolineae bacterium]
MRYLYLGDKLTDPKLKGRPCDPVLRHDGKCITSKLATMLVRFDNGEVACVLRKQLSLRDKGMQYQSLIVQYPNFPKEVDRTVTHAKITIKDGVVVTTFGKLNKDGHYHPNRKLVKAVSTPVAGPLLHDGAGWNWEQVKMFVEAAEIANWQRTGV